MERRKHIRPGGKGPGRFALGMGLFLLVLAALVTVVDIRLRPVLESMAAHYAKVAAIRCINGAMAEIMAENGVSYSDIVSVNKNEKGDISSLQTNMVLINDLKLQSTDRIIEEIQKEGNQILRISLGNLTGIQLLSGRGPDIEIRTRPVGYVQTRLYDQFTSAGINQTLHRIMMETGIEMMIMLPGYTVRAETVTDYCVAETVIVGAVPEGYANIELGGGAVVVPPVD